MATLTQVFARTSFPTTPDSVIYSVPAEATAAIVTNIIVTNTAATSETFNISFDGVEMFKDAVINGKATISIDLKQPILAPSGEVSAWATTSNIRIHMSGVFVI